VYKPPRDMISIRLKKCVFPHLHNLRLGTFVSSIRPVRRNNCHLYVYVNKLTGIVTFCHFICIVSVVKSVAVWVYHGWF